MTGRDVPLLSDIGIIALVADRWADPWMPRHQLWSITVQNISSAGLSGELRVHAVCVNG